MAISLAQLRQTAAEVLASAVVNLFPGVTLVESLISEFGFSYDFISSQPIDVYAIPLIEEKMRGIVKKDEPIQILSMMRENAAEFFRYKKQPVKAEFIEAAQENIVSIFQLDDFYDFSSEGFSASVREAAVFKILKAERIERLVPPLGKVEVLRIRGTAFFETKALKNYLKALEKAKKRDHRLLGKEMGFFAQHEKASSLSYFWRPKGVVFLELLKKIWQDAHRFGGYQFLITPLLVKESLFKKEKKNDRKVLICEDDEEAYLIPNSKQMCHSLEYSSASRSIVDLPIRFAECSHAVAEDGVLWGLLNASLVSKDFAYTYCTLEQVEEILISSLQIIDKIIKMFGLECHWRFAEDQQNLGTKAARKDKVRHEGGRREGIRQERVRQALIKAFERVQTSCELGNETDLVAASSLQGYLIDSLGREWIGPKITVDLKIADRYDINYEDPEGQMRRPIVVAHSVFGSLERFTAILLEHFAGVFPLWLVPEQIRVITLGDSYKVYAQEIYQELCAKGYRVGTDFRVCPLGKKIHGAENEKIPYVVVIGDKEEKQNLITVRSFSHNKGQMVLKLESFIAKLYEETNSKVFTI